MRLRERVVVGVDIGGTKVAAGLVTTRGEIRARVRTPMRATGNASEGLEAVISAIRQLVAHSGADSDIQAIGVCAPGPLDPRTGVIINPPNVPCWRNFPLADEIRRVYGVSAKVDNDANAAALAEAKWGAGRGYGNVFYATIGTGIGTGIVFDGRIFHGRTGAAPEGGHLGIDPHGPRCNCGKRGCIEVLASGPAIARRAREKLLKHSPSVLLEMAGGSPEGITSEMVAKAYASGDPLAKEVLSETLDLLAYWLGNIIDLLEPDVIVMGGGVSIMLAPFTAEIRARWEGACLNPQPQETPLVLAHYGEDAGIAGAAAICDPL